MCRDIEQNIHHVARDSSVMFSAMYGVTPKVVDEFLCRFLTLLLYWPDPLDAKRVAFRQQREHDTAIQSVYKFCPGDDAFLSNLISKFRSPTTTDSTTQTTYPTTAPSENPVPSPTLSDTYVSLLWEKYWTVQELFTICPTSEAITQVVHIGQHLWAVVASSILPTVDSGDVSFVPPSYAEVYVSRRPAENIAPVVIDMALLSV